MKPRLAAAAAGLLSVLPFMASAQPVTGPYVGAGAGINLWHDSTSRGFRINDEDIGIVGLGSLGYGFGNGLRAEVEGNFRESEIDRIAGPGPGGIVGTSGYLRNYGVMGNVLFDLDFSGFGFRPGGLMPYVGVGAGYVWTEIKNARVNVGGSSFRIDDMDGNFAYQGILGLAYGFNNAVPGLALTSEVRYLGTLNPKLDIDRTAGPAQASVPGSLRLENNNISVLLGLRYAFMAPRPAPVAEAPPPAPPPATARTYLVFFDWNRADLTSRAREIIAEAAQNARRVSSTRIEVAGHADRSGTPQYNQRLSQRRAEVVASELVARGISRNEIGVTAFGESRPLVPTADGVREPQNRRVEIVLR
ncbi:OmpA family protein [Craurococcus roseus]|uniref:OmpA family protein n=1 Tax=Craurococcus roseus TaxID=77585 RepID=A0ABN1G9G5_9PROT